MCKIIKKATYENRKWLIIKWRISDYPAHQMQLVIAVSDLVFALTLVFINVLCQTFDRLKLPLFSYKSKQI